MKRTLYEFTGADQVERWILVSESDNGYRSILENARSDDMSITRRIPLGELLQLYKDCERIEREPTSLECGTTNTLDYAYREAIGNPLNVYELIDAKRLFLIPDRMPNYDGAHYMARVINMAASNDCLPSLMSALSRLCCRDDCVIVMSQDSPVGSFFWRQLNVDEFDKAYQDYKDTGNFIIPNRQYYHGGLIGHRAWKNDKPTDIMDWSVHT